MTSPTLDRVLDAVLRVDTQLAVKFVSEPGLLWLRRLGITGPTANFLDILHAEDAVHVQHAITSGAATFSCDARLVHDGQENWANIRAYRLSSMEQYVLCLIDITPWTTADTALRRAAEYDELTGMLNRASLKRAVDARTQDSSRVFSIALLDLDGFKKVNDTFGHAVGDAVLMETARRLVKAAGSADVMARLGGDEFVLLFSDKTADEVKDVLTRVLQAIARPYDTSPHHAYLGVSIGIAEHPAHGTDYATLLKNADAAMYQSKNAGKHRISVFTSTPQNTDFSIKAAMYRGIEEGEFRMEYQPQFDIHRRMVGAEALMRWTSQDLGVVSPDKFIPIAEESGIMPFLGRWALRFACHQLKRLQQHRPGFVMSVNVSAVQFSADDFDTQVLEAVQEADIDPATLILEITESTLMRSQKNTERALAHLREQGIRFSIDDFGTGFSSLAYLTRLPVSSIKIDKAFINAMELETAPLVSNKKLVTAMINLAHSIDLKVVAEGVETEMQFNFLQHAGCNQIQGYLLAKPLPAQALENLLQSQPGATA